MVRLVDGPSANKGRLEVRVPSYATNEQWGTVCDDLSAETAAITCLQLGFGEVSEDIGILVIE